MIKLKEIHWGMIGCGDVAEVKSGPAFNEIKGSGLFSVMRRNAKKAEDYAKRHGIKKWYANADDLIYDTDVNAIYVATPPDSHAKYTIKALEAGKPVYCEKPMALNHKECVKMIETSEKTGVPLYIAYYRRGLDEFNFVRNQVQKGKIGNVRLVNLTLCQPAKPEDHNKKCLPWRVKPEIAGGGYFVDLAPHQIDILQYILGDLQWVSGIAVNQANLYPAEDAVAAAFRFENGTVGTGTWSFTADESAKTDEIEIVGSQGSIRFACFDHVPVQVITKEGNESFSFSRPAHIQQPFIQTVVDKLLGHGNCPGNLKQAARTNWFIDEVLHSYYKGRK